MQGCWQRPFVIALCLAGAAASADEVTDFAGDGPSACPPGYKPLRFVTTRVLDRLCGYFEDQPDGREVIDAFRLAGTASVRLTPTGCMLVLNDPEPLPRTICESGILFDSSVAAPADED